MAYRRVDRRRSYRSWAGAVVVYRRHLSNARRPDHPMLADRAGPGAVRRHLVRMSAHAEAAGRTQSVRNQSSCTYRQFGSEHVCRRPDSGEEIRDDLGARIEVVEPWLVPAGHDLEAGTGDQRGLAPPLGDRLVPGVAVAPEHKHRPTNPGKLGIAQYVPLWVGALAAELLAQVAGDSPGQARAPCGEITGADKLSGRRVNCRAAD